MPAGVCHTYTWTMSDEPPIQTLLSTDVPLAAGLREQDVVLLLLVCVLGGGTLTLMLLLCHRCCCAGQTHCSRVGDDLEKTNTTYTEEAQTTADITIRVDSVDTLESGEHHAKDTLVTAAGTGRRVSFNEAAICEQNKREQEKGRRYTLTEGDFHHLKKARLMPPPLILTIMESESPEKCPSEGSTLTTSLAVIQPAEHVVPLQWISQSPSCALPGDTFSSALNLCRGHTPKPTRSHTMGQDPSFSAAQGTVLHFLSRLRRHASLEGAGPFLSSRRWRTDRLHRTASLDIRGSPRRRAFQRQRAASETLDQDEELDREEASDRTLMPRRLSARSLDPRPEHSAPINRMEVQAVMELGSEGKMKEEEELEVREEELRVKEEELESGQDVVAGASRQESLYRDIWSLRASLEQCASSDLSSNDRDSTRSDADSVCSTGPFRPGVPSYQSQDIDDEMDGDGELPYDEVPRDATQKRNRSHSAESERTSDGETNSRKLLQMDSGYASIEAPCKAPEELRLFGSVSGKTASERRRFFTSAGRKGTVCESLESRLFKEELEDEVAAESQSKPPSRFWRRDYSIDQKTEALFNQFLRHDPQFDQLSSSALRHRHRSRVHLRKQWQRSKQYSDPGAARFSPSLERQRCFPLRRGDSANFPLDTRYHSTLPRIASAADEEASEGDAGLELPDSDTTSPAATDPPWNPGGSAPDLEENANNSSNNRAVGEKCGIPEGDPTDKLAFPLEERLYSHLRTNMEHEEHVVLVSRTAPDAGHQ